MGTRLRIAFVDDDPQLLTNLRRAMLAMLDDWEMAFFGNAQDLLERMPEWRCDVVVADSLMPVLDGASLLELIAKEYPDCIRAIMAGADDLESMYRTIGPAHFYLTKPCQPQILKRAIERRQNLRLLLTGPALTSLLEGFPNLPSAPQLFLQLVAELKSPRASTATVSAIIQKDVAMTAELLKLSNSSYFAVKAVGATALQAVRMLGLEIVQTLVLQIGVFRQFSGSPEMEHRLNQINHYSYALGGLAEKVALTAGEPDYVGKAAQCAALLSVIGSLILLHGKEAAYLDLLGSVGPENPLHDAEIAQFGNEHTLIGAKLLCNWGFADSVVEAVAYSSVPGEAQSLRNPLLTALHVARVLGPNFPLVPAGDYCAVILDRPYLEEHGHMADLENWLALVVPSKKKARG